MRLRDPVKLGRNSVCPVFTSLDTFQASLSQFGDTTRKAPRMGTDTRVCPCPCHWQALVALCIRPKWLSCQDTQNHGASSAHLTLGWCMSVTGPGGPLARRASRASPSLAGGDRRASLDRPRAGLGPQKATNLRRCLSSDNWTYSGHQKDPKALNDTKLILSHCLGKPACFRFCTNTETAMLSDLFSMHIEITLKEIILLWFETKVVF